jgi:hypothetical protein
MLSRDQSNKRNVRSVRHPEANFSWFTFLRLVHKLHYTVRYLRCVLQTSVDLDLGCISEQASETNKRS